MRYVADLTPKVLCTSQPLGKAEKIGYRYILIEVTSEIF